MSERQSEIRFAVDLTWLRPSEVGGIEYYARNLVSGFEAISKKNNFEVYLITTNDNSYLFEEYKRNPAFKVIIGNLNAKSKTKRLLWQNLRLSKLLKDRDLDICVEPVYIKPALADKAIRFITTIHDLQAAHFPEYFNPARVAFMKASWKSAVTTSTKVVVTSDYVKKDIMSRYHVPEEKLIIAGDPVTIDVNEIESEEYLLEFDTTNKGYYYMASSLLPHKNLETVIKAMAILKRKNSAAFAKILISGIGGKSRDEIEKLIKEGNLSGDVIFTPYLTISQRNTLYKYCRVYLAPSLFEGFGMTPIEAIIMGATVITTKETCSYEVTGGIVNYVNDARDPQEWADMLESELIRPDKDTVDKLVANYSKENIASIIFNNILSLN